MVSAKMGPEKGQMVLCVMRRSGGLLVVIRTRRSRRVSATANHPSRRSCAGVLASVRAQGLSIVVKKRVIVLRTSDNTTVTVNSTTFCQALPSPALISPFSFTHHVTVLSMLAASAAGGKGGPRGSPLGNKEFDAI